MSIGILDLAYGNSFKPGLTPQSLPLNSTSFLSGITVTGNNFSFSETGNYQVNLFIDSDFSGSDGSRIMIDVYNVTKAQSVGNFQIDSNSGEASWMIPLTVTDAADQYTVRAVTYSNQPGTIKAARIVPTNLGSSSSGSGGSADVQVFGTPGSSTWTKPSGKTYTQVICIGGGGGGASGCKGAAGTERIAATGGGGGGFSVVNLLISALAATEVVNVGAGGAGGAAVSANSTSGNAGGAGGNSWFGGSGVVGDSLVRALGAGANVGPSIDGSSASGTTGLGTLGNGQQSSNNFSGLPTSMAFATGGGAGSGASGGGIDSGNTAYAGGDLSDFGAAMYTVVSGGSNTGGNGATPAAGNFPAGYVGGRGGSGGGANLSGNGGSGGNGAGYGSGGGGGGAAVNSVGNSGAGGAGADGVVVVISW